MPRHLLAIRRLSPTYGSIGDRLRFVSDAPPGAVIPEGPSPHAQPRRTLIVSAAESLDFGPYG